MEPDERIDPVTDDTNATVLDTLREILGVNSAANIGPATDESFAALREHNSFPTVPLSDIEQVRFSELAAALRETRTQAYIEANFGIQVLKLLQTVIPMIVGTF